MTNYYKVESTYGLSTAGEAETLFTPGEPRPAGKYGCILLHGSGATNYMFSEAARWASSELAAELALAGIPCLSIQMGGNTYANDVAMDAIDDAITYLAAATGVPSTKVCLLGISMGGGTAVRYAEVNPAKVAAVVGLIPFANPQYVYENNIGGLQGAIGAAWGVTYPTPLPAGADLIGNASAIDAANIPVKFWYDDVDTLIRPIDVTNLAAACGGTATAVEVDPADLGHTEGTIKAVIDSGAGRSSEIINFLYANGA